MDIEYERERLDGLQRADGWPHIVKPYVKCGQAMRDDMDAKEKRRERLDRYRALAGQGKPLCLLEADYESN